MDSSRYNPANAAGRSDRPAQVYCVTCWEKGHDWLECLARCKNCNQEHFKQTCPAQPDMCLREHHVLSVGQERKILDDINQRNAQLLEQVIREETEADALEAFRDRVAPLPGSKAARTHKFTFVPPVVEEEDEILPPAADFVEISDEAYKALSQNGKKKHKILRDQHDVFLAGVRHGRRQLGKRAAKPSEAAATGPTGTPDAQWADNGDGQVEMTDAPPASPKPSAETA